MKESREMILITFNKYFYDMMEDIRSTSSDDIISSIDKNYKERVSKTSKNMDLWRSNMSDSSFMNEMMRISKTPFEQICESPFLSEALKKRFILNEVSLADLAKGVDVSYHPTILSYMSILSLFLRLYDFKDTQSTEKEMSQVVDTLFENAINVIIKMEKGEDYSSQIKSIGDEETIGILNALQSFKNMCKEVDQNDNSQSGEDSKESERVDDDQEKGSHVKDDMENFMEGIQKTLKGTKIGKITEEIVDDLSKDLQDDIGDITDFQSFMQSGKLGNVINKTVEHFQKKNQSGELNQNDIVKECVNLMGMFGNPFGNQNNSSSGVSGGQSANAGGSGTSDQSPFDMGDLQKVMSLFSGEDKFKLDTNKLQNMEKNMKTKERMRRKLEEKRSSKS